MHIQWELPRTVCQEPNHAPPGIEEAAYRALSLIMVPITPFLHVSQRKLGQMNDRKQNDLRDSDVPPPRGDQGICGARDD